jgi:outer membrane PBP1 activator LpoA protein
MLSSIFSSGLFTIRTFMRKNLTIPSLILCATTLMSACSTHVGGGISNYSRPIVRDNNQASSIENPAFWQGNPEMVWGKLQQTPLDKLELLSNTAVADEVGWVKLAIISKRYSTSTADLTRELTAWRALYPDHPGNKLFPSDATLTNLSNTPAPKNIALLLPLSGKFANLGNATRNGFLNAYYEISAKTHYQQNIAFYDTATASSMQALYQQAVSKGANLVVGPLTKEDVAQLAASGNLTVPTVALNYTDSWGSLPNNLYEFGLSPLDETKQVADKAFENGYTHALIIAPQTEWGQMAAKNLISHWRADGGSVTDTYYFTPQSNLTADIPALLHIDPKADRTKMHDKADKATLEQQRRQDFDIVFLLAPPTEARQIVPLLKYYYVTKEPIYSTSVVYSGSPQPQKDMDLNGVMFCEIPWTLGRGGSNRLSAVGHDAYVISYDMARFSTLPNFPLYGATGEISLTPQKQFYRRMAWAKFHDGQP